MELYQLRYILHEPCEAQGWLYMAEIPELSGCRAWAETAGDTLTELNLVAEQGAGRPFVCGSSSNS